MLGTSPLATRASVVGSLGRWVLVMIGTMTEVEQDDLLRRMHDKLESVSELIELERQFSDGFEIDEERLDSKFAACVDLVMSEEMEWI